MARKLAVCFPEFSSFYESNTTRFKFLSAVLTESVGTSLRVNAPTLVLYAYSVTTLIML